MTEVVVTVWDRVHSDPAVRAVLDRVRPQWIQLHVDCNGLIRDGKKATANLRLWYPGVRIAWGIPGDGHGPDPSNLWLRTYNAAIDAGVQLFMLDMESAWKTRPNSVAIAAHCMAKLAGAKTATSPRIGYTGFDTVNAVGYKDANGVQRYWGGHGDMPWKAILGPDSPVDEHYPQVYAAGSGDAPKGSLQTRDRRSRKSLDSAIVRGTIRSPGQGLAWHVYLQSHHTPEEDLIAVARTYKRACFWASPTRLDERGIGAMERLARMHDAAVAGKLVGEAAVPPPLPGPDVECNATDHPESATHGEHC